MRCNLVWLKRDIRLYDNELIQKAEEVKIPYFIFYCFEELLIEAPDNDIRHWRFVYESIIDLNSRLKYPVIVFVGKLEKAFDLLFEYHSIAQVFSYRETGLQHTFDRDKAMKKYFQSKNICWLEMERNGIKRGNESYRNSNLNESYFQSEIQKLSGKDLNQNILHDELNAPFSYDRIPKEFTVRNNNFQKGGEKWAWEY